MKDWKWFFVLAVVSGVAGFILLRNEWTVPGVLLYSLSLLWVTRAVETYRKDRNDVPEPELLAEDD